MLLLIQLDDALWTSHLTSESPLTHQPLGPVPALSQAGKMPEQDDFCINHPESPGIEQLRCTTRILAARKKAVMGKARSKQGRCPSTAGSSQHLPLLPYLWLELNPPCSSPWQRIRTHQFSIRHQALFFFLYFFLNYLTIKQLKEGLIKNQRGKKQPSVCLKKQNFCGHPIPLPSSPCRAGSIRPTF